MFSTTIFGGDSASGSGSDVKLKFENSTFLYSFTIGYGDFSIYNKSSLHNESSSSQSVLILGK